MNGPIETIERKLGNLTAVIEISYDEDIVCPNDEDEVIVFNASRGADLHRQAQAEFGKRWQLKVAQLAEGKTVKTEDAFYYGFEEYRHSGSAFALCSSPGNFPDRRWDVIELAGWVKIPATFARDNELDMPRMRDFAKGMLEQWGSYVNGECYWFNVSIRDEGGNEVEAASCGGFLGDIDYCRTEAIAEAEALLKNQLKVEV